MNVDPETTVTIGSGSVEYDIAEAAIPIEDLIELLESAKSEGATHAVGVSGNFRGAQWTRIPTRYDWASD